MSSEEKEKFLSKEHKWKELLYELFYEIKSELLGCKIEIDEEEFQQNIKQITIPKLVDYLHDFIQILIKKKMEDAKKEQKKYDIQYYTNNVNNILNIDEKSQYENLIRKLESKERSLSRIIFKKQLQKDMLENKISEYMDMEEEFEEMKTKLKYEEGRFLKNDRKNNEILILRGENSNLKQSIKQLETKIKNLETDLISKSKKLYEYLDEIKKVNKKYKELQKQNEILNANYINININNVNGNNKNSNINNNYNNNISYPQEETKNLNKNKILRFQKINKKLLYKEKTINNTRNEFLERSKSDLNKHILNNKNNNILLNNTTLKVNSPKYNNKPSNPSNVNELPIPVFSSLMNVNNYNYIQRNIISGINSTRSNSTKIKGNKNKIINYKYLL